MFGGALHQALCSAGRVGRLVIGFKSSKRYAMDLFADIRDLVVASLDAMVAQGDLTDGLDYSAIDLEPPKDAAHGDMACNAAMVLAGPAGRDARLIAQGLADLLIADPRIALADVAGPGFLNITIAAGVWPDVIGAILRSGADYGRVDIGTGTRVNVEYASAYPTGPLHVSYARGAVVGDVLARLLAHMGHSVTREYFVNDGGPQVGALARTVYLRYLQAHGRDVALPDEGLPGAYLIKVGAALKDSVGAAYLDLPESAWMAELRAFSTDGMMTLIRADLAALGIEMDVYFAESTLHETGRIEAAVDELTTRGLIYEGALESDPDTQQTLFKSTDFGDDTDRPVKTSDGRWTYFAPDLAYHFDKIARGFDVLINVFGADHGAYVKRMKAAVCALSDGRVAHDIKLCKLVRLTKEGAPFTASPEPGGVLSVGDLVEIMGRDALRFHLTMRRPDAVLALDLDDGLEPVLQNPAFAVQYVHARACQRLVQAGFSPDDLSGISPPGKGDAVDGTLAAKLSDWPRIMRLAAELREPYRIAGYLVELSELFHEISSAAAMGDEIPPSDGDGDRVNSKTGQAAAVKIVISTGLAIMGITPAREMR